MLMKWFTPISENEAKKKLFCLPNPFINRDGWRLGKINADGIYCIDFGFGHLFIEFGIREDGTAFTDYVDGYLYFWGEPGAPWDAGDEENFMSGEYEDIAALCYDLDDEAGWRDWSQTHTWMKIG